MLSELEDRVGKFRLSSDRLKRMSRNELRDFFAHFVIVRAEHLFYCNAIEYTAYSELFDLVDEGESLPDYLITLKVSDSGVTELDHADRQ